MALVLQDRVSVNSTGSGTGNLALGSAYPGYRTFTSCIPDGSIVYYAITNQAVGYDTEWEVGYGKYVLSTDTLVRNNGNAAETGVYSSSNSNAYVNFTAGTNGLQVFITQPAEQAVYQQPDGITEFNEGPISVVGANATPASFDATLAQFFSNVPSYSQLIIQNQSSDANASTDIVAYNNLGDGSSYFIDMGIESSNYNSVDYPIFQENDAYLFNAGNVAGTGAAGDISRLLIGTSTANSNVVIFGGSVETNAVIATFVASSKDVNFANGISVTGNVSASNANFTTAAYVSSNVALITAANQLVTKEYVDTTATTGIHIHEPVLVETTGNLTATYTQGGTTFNITDITTANTVTTSTTHSLALNDQIWLTGTAGNGLSANVAYFVNSIPAANQLTLSLTFGGAEITTLTNAAGLTYPVRANSGVGATLTNSGANVALAIDGVNLASTNRVMVRLQTNPAENGVYTVTTVGAPDAPGPGAAWVLTRATDANQVNPSNPDGVGTGDYFYTQSGLVNAGDSHVLTTEPNTMIIGYTGLTYTQFSGAVTYTGTAPINVSGQTIALTGVVDEAHGGTNASTYTTGDIIYSNASNTLAKLAIGSQYNVLAVSGAGVPHWSTVNLANANAVTGALPATNGGTGQTTYTTGDILYSSAANTLSKLAGQTTTTQKFLSQTGDGVNSAAPVWDTIPAGSVTGLGTMSTQNANAVTITGGTLNNVVIGGTTANAATFTTANATTFNGSGAGLTTLNGSNVSSGTVANARTTATNLNTASAIVARDAGGNFTATTITANLTGTASSATTATTATTANNIAGGAAGGIPYQTGSGATSILATGSGVLVGGTTPSYSTAPTLTGSNFSSIPNSATTATAANTASAIVARDASGNFTAGTITAALNGNANTATSATSAGSATTAVTVTGAAQANITSVGTLTSLTSSGTITASSFSGAGTGLTGTASSLSIGGNSATATGLTSSNYITSGGSSGDWNTDFQNTTANTKRYNGDIAGGTNNPGGTWWFQEDMRHSNASNYWGTQIAWGWEDNANKLAQRNVTNGTFGSWVYYLNSGNYNSYSPTLTGTGASGTWGINVTGSSATATTATTATTANALNTANNYQVNSLGVNTAGSGTAGEIRATNNITAFYSDERLKTKIGDIENALDKVCSIETMIYHANETAVALGYDASIVEVGVTAQSVQKVQPEVVVPAPIDENYLTVRYEKLVPLLIEAIKELKAQVAELKYPKTGA